MSTWEYIISSPIEDVHYGINRFHYRCVSLGLTVAVHWHDKTHKWTLHSCAKLWNMSWQLWSGRRRKKSWISGPFQSFSSSFLFLRSTERQVGHVAGICVRVHSPFSCIRLVRTCTEASFEKPGKMQSVPLHFQVTVHTVKNFSKLGWSEHRKESELLGSAWFPRFFTSLVLGSEGKSRGVCVCVHSGRCD